MDSDSPTSPPGRGMPANTPASPDAPGDAGRPPRRTRRGARPPVAPAVEAAVTAPPDPVVVHGPRVPTSVTFTRPGTVRLRIEGGNDPTELDGDVVAALFAVGLQTPEPDRTGWVVIGELTIDDEVIFAVGTTDLDPSAAAQAVCRGVERALFEGLTHPRDPSPATPENQDTP